MPRFKHGGEQLVWMPLDQHVLSLQSDDHAQPNIKIERQLWQLKMQQQKSRNQLTSSKECCKILSVSSFFPPPPVAHVRALCQRRDALEKRVEPERNLRRWEALLLEAATNIQHPFGRFVVVFPEPQAHMENAPAQGFAKNCNRFICLGFTLTEYIRIKSVSESIVFFGWEKPWKESAPTCNTYSCRSWFSTKH